MTDLEKVKNILLEKASSLVVYKDGKITEYYNNGIKDLITVLNENVDALNGSIIADKVIGKVATSIMVKAGVKEIYAKVISKLAIPILEENNIKFEYDTKIEYIQNRDKTGMCPMESKFKDETNIDIIWKEYIKGGIKDMKSKVLMTKNISSDGLVNIYKALGRELKGKVAVKVHSGEAGNQNYLHPEFMKLIIEYVNGTVVECNTAYEGERNNTEKHKKLLADHGWSKHFNVDLMDAEGKDLKLEIPNGKVITENYLGKNIANYDSMLVLSHFKGHPMGGFGGALKQLSIGCASAEGKAWIHSAGKLKDQTILWNNLPEQDLFLESMAEAASSVVEYFKGNMIFINIMCNMSVDCDCCAVAEDPCMRDIGILASLDPVAIDQACVDLVYASEDTGKDHFIKRVESRHGIHTVERAEELGIGSREYELVSID